MFAIMKVADVMKSVDDLYACAVAQTFTQDETRDGLYVSEKTDDFVLLFLLRMTKTYRHAFNNGARPRWAVAAHQGQLPH